MKQVVSVRIWAQVLGLFVWVPAASAIEAAGRLTSPSEPLIHQHRPAGWSAGVYYTADRRELKAAGEVLELDGSRVVAEVGVEIAPILQLAAQAGWVSADLEDGDGENGLAWAAIARLNLADIVLEDSPVVGHRKWMGAAVDLQYRFNESNQDQADLEWRETRVVPHVYYFQNLHGDALRKDFQATGYGIHGGLVFSGIDGDLGPDELEENRNFGFLIGADIRWASSWVAQARATVFGSGDQVLEIGTRFNF